MTEDFNSPGYDIPPDMQGEVSITTLDKVSNWSRQTLYFPADVGRLERAEQ